MDIGLFANQKNIEKYRRLASAATTTEERKALLIALGEEFTNAQEVLRLRLLAADAPNDGQRDAILRLLAIEETRFEAYNAEIPAPASNNEA